MAIARCCTNDAYFLVPPSSTCFRVNHVNSSIFTGVNPCWFSCGIFYVVPVLLVLNRQVRPCCHRHANQESCNNRKSLFHFTQMTHGGWKTPSTISRQGFLISLNCLPANDGPVLSPELARPTHITKRQVKRCIHELSPQWDDEQLEAVVSMFRARVLT